MVKYSRLQSTLVPSRFIWSRIAPPYRLFPSPTRFTNASRPISCRVLPSAVSARSTSICVAIPAWSVPGTHSAVSPNILCQRIIMSDSACSNMCPMCRNPVTLGGGSSMVNFFVVACVPSDGTTAPSGETMSNSFSWTQYLAQRSSISDGSYALGSSWLISVFKGSIEGDKLSAACNTRGDGMLHSRLTRATSSLGGATLLLLLAMPAFSQSSRSNDHASFGNDITVTEGETAADIACAFCSVHVHGDVKGDVAVLFGSVVLDSDHRISGDVAILGGDLTAGDDAQVGGDVAIAAGDLNLAPN